MTTEMEQIVAAAQRLVILHPDCMWPILLVKIARRKSGREMIIGMLQPAECHGPSAASSTTAAKFYVPGEPLYCVKRKRGNKIARWWSYRRLYLVPVSRSGISFSGELLFEVRITAVCYISTTTKSFFRNAIVYFCSTQKLNKKLTCHRR